MSEKPPDRPSSGSAARSHQPAGGGLRRMAGSLGLFLLWLAGLLVLAIAAGAMLAAGEKVGLRDAVIVTAAFAVLAWSLCFAGWVERRGRLVLAFLVRLLLLGWFAHLFIASLT